MGWQLLDHHNSTVFIEDKQDSVNSREYIEQFADGMDGNGRWPELQPQRIRFSLFFDAGSLWDKERTINSSTGEMEGGFSDGLRYSTGLAFTWLSPMGPLKFSYAVPLKKKREDNLQRFQFQMGTTF